MPMIRGKDGTEIYVYDPNPKAKEIVVFLHGWPLNHQMFEYQFSAMSEFRCIGIDLRGFGRSSAPDSEYSYDEYCDDLAQVVRQMGLRSFTLVGFSMGGGAALHYMRHSKGLGAKKLALIAAAAPSFTKQAGFPYGIDKANVTGLISRGLQNRPAMIQDFNKIFFTGKTQNQEFKDWCTFLTYQASAAGTIKSLYTLRDANLCEDTSYVTVPAAIFHGKLDQVCLYEIGEQLHKMINRSQMHTFEQSGHCIFHDEKERLNAQLKDFILSN